MAVGTGATSLNADALTPQPPTGLYAVLGHLTCDGTLVLNGPVSVGLSY